MQSDMVKEEITVLKNDLLITLLLLIVLEKEESGSQCHLVKCHWDFQRHREINFNFTMPFFLSVKH